MLFLVGLRLRTCFTWDGNVLSRIGATGWLGGACDLYDLDVFGLYAICLFTMSRILCNPTAMLPEASLFWLFMPVFL